MTFDSLADCGHHVYHRVILVQSWSQVWSASDMMRILTLLQQLGMIGRTGGTRVGLWDQNPEQI